MSDARAERLQSFIEMADDLIPRARQTPRAGYRERVVDVQVWDLCDAGGETDAGTTWSLDVEDLELLRQLAAGALAQT